MIFKVFSKSATPGVKKVNCKRAILAYSNRLFILMTDITHSAYSHGPPSNTSKQQS